LCLFPLAGVLMEACDLALVTWGRLCLPVQFVSILKTQNTSKSDFQGFF